MAAERGAAAAAEDLEAAVEAGDQLGEGDRAQADGGQLQGERDAVEAVREGEGALAVCGGQGGAAGHGGGALHEQLDGVVAGQRRDRYAVLAGHVQRLPAGGEDAQPRRLAQQDVAEHRAGVDEVLAGVQDYQQPPLPQMFDHGVQRAHPRLLGQLQHPGHGRRDQLGVVQRGQLHQPYPVGEPPARRPGRAQRGTALAHATRADERHQPRPVQGTLDQGEFLGPAHEAGELHRELPAAPLPEAESHAAPVFAP